MAPFLRVLSRTLYHLFPFRSARAGAVALLAAGLLCAPGYAQFRASIQGVVTDPTGAVIPDATLTLTNNATNEKQVSTSNGEGVYTFNALPPGAYTLVASHTGFSTKTYNNVQIIPEQANSMNVQLAVSTAPQETVTVNAAQTPLINTENGTIEETISSNQVQHMPTFGRDVFQLAQLAPGSIGDQSQGSGGGAYQLLGSKGPSGPSSNGGIFMTENAPQTEANGNEFENNSIQIDGISTVSAVWGGASVVTPTEESVDDVHVVTNSYDAEFGRFSGAQIQVTTKSGTNHVHGSAFFQRWSPGMNAYQRYNGPTFYNTSCTNSATGLPGPCTPAQRGLQKDTQQFNQYGGSLGGPLWKNRLFAFFAYEGERSGVISATSTGWYDTSAFDKLAPSGSIASTYLTFPGESVSGTLIPATCAEVGLTEGLNCATIPGQGLNIGSPLTSPLGTQDPGWTGPSNPGTGGGLGTTADIAEYTSYNPTTITNDQYSGRLDADITSKDRLTGTIYWIPSNTTNYNGPVRPMDLWHHDVINNAFTGIWNHIFNANLLNEARFNVAGWRFNEVSANPQAPFGLPSDSISQIGSINNFQPFGAPGPGDYNQWTYGYRDVATKVMGRHNIKFGGELTRLYYLNIQPYSARPNYNFFNIWDFLNDAPQSESGQFDPATGTPSAARQDDRENIWGIFVQDDFRAAPSLTLNLGLRYNYFGALYAKQGDMFDVQFGSGDAMLTGLSMRRGGSAWTPQKLNFGPEFGFAWSPIGLKNRAVIRGGFGLNYNQYEIALSSNNYSNPGITIPANFTIPTPTSPPNPGILYATATSVHSLYGYPSNPAVAATGATAFGPNGLPTTGATTLTAFPQKMDTEYVEHFSLETEYDAGFRSVVSLGYSASLSRHTLFQYDENAVASVHSIPLNPSVNGLLVIGNNGSANYNSMIATVRHEMSHGFQLEADFNWAKSLDISSAPYVFQDYPYDPALSYGPSDYNVGKLFKVFGMWQPVFFHGGHSWAEKIVGGWNLSGDFNIHTGFPWTPTYPLPGNLYSAGGTVYGNIYSSLLPGAYLGGAGHDTSNSAYKSGPGVGNGVNVNFPNAATATGTAYFAPPTYTLGPAFPATGAVTPQPPGISRNSMRGPGYKAVNATLSKTFGMPKLHEGAGLELRADAFNVFNNLNFNPSSISNTITNTNFGQAQSALGGRTMTVQASFNF